MTSQQFEKIKQDISDAQTRKDKLQGALEQLKERMKKEYGVETVEELQALLAKTKEQVAALQLKFDVAMDELEIMVPTIV